MPSHFVGLVLENCDLPYANHGHVILGDPSPILFYPISSTEIRCLVDVPGHKLPSLANGDMAHYLRTVVAPQVCMYMYYLELRSSAGRRMSNRLLGLPAPSHYQTVLVRLTRSAENLSLSLSLDFSLGIFSSLIFEMLSILVSYDILTKQMT